MSCNMPILSAFRHFNVIVDILIFKSLLPFLISCSLCSTDRKRFCIRTRISLFAVSFLLCSFTDGPVLYLKGLTAFTPFIHVYMFVLSGHPLHLDLYAS